MMSASASAGARALRQGRIFPVRLVTDSRLRAPATVCRIKKRFLDEGLQSALEEPVPAGRPSGRERSDCPGMQAPDGQPG